MMKIKETGKLPIYSWASYIEDGAEAQAMNLALHPFTVNHVALMPDCHSGYGMPIGGVIATKGVIIPNAVGVDIGCGMRAVRTNLRELDVSTIIKIVEKIQETIPVGHNHNKDAFPLMMPERPKGELEVVEKEYDSACHQIGTLGGGNHFIELQKSSLGDIWIMVHSGSRNIGKKVADHYQTIARKYTEESDNPIPKAWELDFLPMTSIGDVESLGFKYKKEMQYCLAFAKANRQFMMLRIQNIFREMVPDVEFVWEHDIHHNYAEWDHIDGKSVYIHRKGATSAKKDQMGIIPGSQGTASYIVEGRGNPQSFQSCSHGSGRKMGRNEAKRKLSLDEQMAILDEKGIVHGMKSVAKLDEAPGAYKDIEEVMENQADLVKKIVRLEPIAVIKG
jgi:tRNA-splicing ligase RtcB